MSTQVEEEEEAAKVAKAGDSEVEIEAESGVVAEAEGRWRADDTRVALIQNEDTASLKTHLHCARLVYFRSAAAAILILLRVREPVYAYPWVT